VIVNDVPVDLPVIRAQGELVADQVEVLFLDDARNPLTLAFRIGIRWRDGRRTDEWN
jgi:hypothetical protein